MRKRAAPRVHGIDLDGQTRCRHYHSPLDVVAIKMRCCGEYYACKECHTALAGHAAQLWRRSERDHKAVLCGCCGTELTIGEYLECSNRCPQCSAMFNPGCRNHYHFYFESE